MRPDADWEIWVAQSVCGECGRVWAWGSWDETALL